MGTMRREELIASVGEKITREIALRYQWNEGFLLIGSKHCFFIREFLGQWRLEETIPLDSIQKNTVKEDYFGRELLLETSVGGFQFDRLPEKDIDWTMVFSVKDLPQEEMKGTAEGSESSVEKNKSMILVTDGPQPSSEVDALLREEAQSFTEIDVEEIEVKEGAFASPNMSATEEVPILEEMVESIIETKRFDPYESMTTKEKEATIHFQEIMVKVLSIVLQVMAYFAAFVFFVVSENPDSIAVVGYIIGLNSLLFIRKKIHKTEEDSEKKKLFRYFVLIMIVLGIFELAILGPIAVFLILMMFLFLAFYSHLIAIKI